MTWMNFKFKVEGNFFEGLGKKSQFSERNTTDSLFSSKLDGSVELEVCLGGS